MASKSKLVMGNMVSASHSMICCRRVAIHFSCNSWLSKVDVSHPHHAAAELEFSFEPLFQSSSTSRGASAKARSIYICMSMGPLENIYQFEKMFQYRSHALCCCNYRLPCVRWTALIPLKSLFEKLVSRQVKLIYTPNIGPLNFFYSNGLPVIT